MDDLTSTPDIIQRTFRVEPDEIAGEEVFTAIVSGDPNVAFGVQVSER